MNISRLRSVPPRELWPREARDFTTWLAENLDLEHTDHDHLGKLITYLSNLEAVTAMFESTQAQRHARSRTLGK
jgi:hypothetical protein